MPIHPIFKKCRQFAKYTNQILIIAVLLKNKFLVYVHHDNFDI